MYAIDENKSATHKSARSTWQKAQPLARRELLQRAGYERCLAYAYRRFNDLPIDVKVGLNTAIEREAQTEQQGNPAPAMPATY